MTKGKLLDLENLQLWDEIGFDAYREVSGDFRDYDHIRGIIGLMGTSILENDCIDWWPVLEFLGIWDDFRDSLWCQP